MATGAGGVCVRLDCAPEPWLITEPEPISARQPLVLALALAALLPTQLQRRLLQRRPPLAAHNALAWRLALAMSLGSYAFLELWQARFIKNYGCIVFPNTFAVPEYLAYLAAQLSERMTGSPRRWFAVGL